MPHQLKGNAQPLHDLEGIELLVYQIKVCHRLTRYVKNNMSYKEEDS